MPLFGTSPLSSFFGMEDVLIIQRPACDSASFDWSDFPILQRDSFFPPSHSPINDEISKSIPVMTPEAFSTSSLDSDFSIASSRSSESNKQVKFSTTLEIRTHSIVLGNHPCCRSLPVELGWEYDDIECIDLEVHELNKAYHRGVRRRSYLERKSLLKCFLGDLEVQSMRETNLRKAAPSSRQLLNMGGVNTPKV
jgi:hypothetical protein